MATARKADGPVRTCIGCREPRPCVELVRLVRDTDGAVVVDISGLMSGRGAYVCGEAACIDRGLRRERLSHAFRAPCRVTPDLGVSVLERARRRDAMARASVK